MKAETDHAKRAVRRAAAGRALERLVKRGLLEHCGRGKWRLTEAGVEVAKVLHPEFKTCP
jgi:Mn-dependent DtxR family transcriptional regulator